MAAPLRRNRDFILLQAGQLLSTAGTQSTTIAYPLLVLALSHSPAKAGLVAFARLTPYGLFGLLAGVAADRWNRKHLMIAADVVRAAAIAALAAAVLSGHASVWTILIVAFVEGTGSTVFSAAQAGALRAVVPASQLADAAGAQEARRATVQLAGPPLGGGFFGLGHALPFLFDAISYCFSTVSLLAMRTAVPGATRPRSSSAQSADRRGLQVPLGPALPAYVRVSLRHRKLRRAGHAADARRRRAPAGTVRGRDRLAVRLDRRRVADRRADLAVLPAHALDRARSCCSSSGRGRAAWLFVIWPNAYVLAAAIVPFGLAAPVTDSVVVSYRIALTPGPAARSRRERQKLDLAARRPARSARRRPPARGDLVSS